MSGLRVPAIYGLALGHTDDQLTIPLGAMAALDATGKVPKVTNTEPAVT